MTSRDAGLAEFARRLAGELTEFANKIERRPQRSKRIVAPRPSAAETAERRGLWDDYIILAMRSPGAPTTELAFCMKHVGIGPDALSRWLTRDGRKYIATGSIPDLRIRQELAAARAELDPLGEITRQVFAPRRLKAVAK
jgi:hypothetical protein